MKKEELKHHVLFIYTFSNLSQKDKVKFIRELFGYKNITKKKVYEHDGLVQKTSSKKLAQNVILAPISESIKLSDFFNSRNIKTTLKEVWLKDV